MNAVLKKILYAFLLTIILNFAAAAQSAFDEPKWTKFEPAGEEFTLEFPNTSATGSRGRLDGDVRAGYLVLQNKTYFAVFSEDDPAASILKQLMGLAVVNATPQNIEIDGISGARYEFTGLDDYEHTLIAIQAPVHFYIFHTISETKNDPLVEQFFGSIKLDRQIPKIEKQNSVKESATPISRADILKPPTAGPIGFKVDMGLNRADIVAPPKYAKVDNAVTILEKPAPSYTELARRYMVVGTVRLRVTFEKNGEVGAITSISKLPLGLTQAAISAARQIRFSPAVRKGEPYATNKLVEYNFRLY